MLTFFHTKPQWENNEEMALQLEKELLVLQNRSESSQASSLRVRFEALERESFNQSLSRLLFGDRGGTAVALSPEAVAQCVGEVLERQLQAEVAAAHQNEQTCVPTNNAPPAQATDGQVTDHIACSVANSGRSALLLQQLEQLVARFKADSSIKF